MFKRTDEKGLTFFDRIALKIIGRADINRTPNNPILVLQYWAGRSNVSVIFATILSSLGIALLLSSNKDLKLVSIVIFLGFFYFSIKTWAYNRCAEMSCRIWL